MKAFKWIGIVLVVLITLFVVLSLTAGTHPKEGFMSTRMGEIESYLTYGEISNTEISQANIAWQLYHTLKAINNITEKLKESDPENYEMNFNFSRTLIFTYGDFPRGVAQAPASVMPPEIITDEALAEQLALAKESLVTIQSLPTKSSFMHDTFGLLNRNDAARLIEVHTDHHLKIIRIFSPWRALTINLE